MCPNLSVKYQISNLNSTCNLSLYSSVLHNSNHPPCCGLKSLSQIINCKLQGILVSQKHFQHYLVGGLGEYTSRAPLELAPATSLRQLYVYTCILK